VTQKATNYKHLTVQYEQGAEPTLVLKHENSEAEAGGEETMDLRNWNLDQILELLDAKLAK